MAYGLSYMPDFSRAYSGITDAGKAIGKGLEKRGENKRKSNKLGGTLEAYADTDGPGTPEEKQKALYGETVDNMGFSQREAAMAKYVAMREQQGRKLFEDFDAASQKQAGDARDNAAMDAFGKPTSFDSSITDAVMGIKAANDSQKLIIEEKKEAERNLNLAETGLTHINRHKEGAKEGYAGGREHKLIPGHLTKKAFTGEAGTVVTPITRKLLPLDSGKVDERTKALQGSIDRYKAKISRLDLDIAAGEATQKSQDLRLADLTAKQSSARDQNMNAARDAASAAPLDIQGALRTAIQNNPQATGMKVEVQNRTKEAQIGAAQDTAKSAAYKSYMDGITAQHHEGSLTRKALTETMAIFKLAQTGDVPVSILQKLTAGSLDPTDMAGLNPAQLKAVGSMITLKVTQQNANTQQKLAQLKEAADQANQAKVGGLKGTEMSFLKGVQQQAADQMEELAKSIQLAKLVAGGNPNQTMYDIPAMEAAYTEKKKEYDELNALTKKVIDDLKKKQGQSGGSSSGGSGGSGGTVFADAAAAKAAGHSSGDTVLISINGVATQVQLN